MGLFVQKPDALALTVSGKKKFGENFKTARGALVVPVTVVGNHCSGALSSLLSNYYFLKVWTTWINFIGKGEGGLIKIIKT